MSAANDTMNNPVSDEMKPVRNLLPISHLSGHHYDVLRSAVANVLDTDIARTTYAQILDGVPLASVAKDVSDYEFPFPGHPMLKEHLNLAPDVVAALEKLRASVPLDTFRVDASTIVDFQAAGPGSRAFQTRLVELVARVLHAVAVWLYQTHSPLRPKDDRLLAWRPEQAEDAERLLKYSYRNGYPPTFFIHPWYKAYDQYPNGVADGVGYWAEDRILGGVVLFDRRGPEAPDTIYEASQLTEAVYLPKQSDALYFHSNAWDVTYRIYRLRDEQKQQLVQFLLSSAGASTPLPQTSSSSSSCPLPIRGDENNRVRIDPEEPIRMTGIYRDAWERRAFAEGDWDPRNRDVVNLFDFLSCEGFSEAFRRSMRMRERFDEEEEERERQQLEAQGEGNEHRNSRTPTPERE
ncbi:hypothetical protein SPI_07307 [Niveomyces insectorum RCEF 264]|uniref:Uncharacterized protein n=1 Tax=Niveomyces insectorum RCEF 264 TaxID=1081102 RepID=A0A167QHH3_9HYPO|nr:hypothetical protein SPI_07307 [Niveomyces insectorum RCEF 264]